MADSKAAVKSDAEKTVLERIREAAEGPAPEAKVQGADAPSAKEVEPKARVEKLFSAVSSELAAAGADIDKLKELQAALQSQAGMVSRAVEAAIEAAIAKAQKDAVAAAEKASAAAPAPAPAPAPAAAAKPK